MLFLFLVTAVSVVEMLLGGAVNGERELQNEVLGGRESIWGGMEDGSWSSISVKGAEYLSSIVGRNRRNNM